MSEALWGVIIGGVIALAPTLIVSFIEYKKWKKGKKIEVLQQKRVRMEKLFNDAYQKILEGITKNSFDIEMIGKIMRLAPRNVSGQFDKMMSDKNRTAENMREHSLLISVEIYNVLASIDKEIEGIVN